MVRTRTRLTTPPGEEPAPPPSAADEPESQQGETYVAFMDVPREPRPPGRYRRLIIALVVLVLLALGAFVAFQVVTSGEDFDPAVGENPGTPATPDD